MHQLIGDQRRMMAAQPLHEKLLAVLVIQYDRQFVGALAQRRDQCPQNQSGQDGAGHAALHARKASQLDPHPDGGRSQ